MTLVKTIRMGFLEDDDRLLLDFVLAETTQTVLITRRITRRLIAGLAEILTRPDPTANQAMARVPSIHKTEMLVWEHLSAIQCGAGGESRQDHETDEPQPRRTPPPWPLLTRVDITPQGVNFPMRWEDQKGAVLTLVMNRDELHRLLATLRQLANQAAWDLQPEVGWLIEADRPGHSPGSLAS